MCSFRKYLYFSHRRDFFLRHSHTPLEIAIKLHTFLHIFGLTDPHPTPPHRHIHVHKNYHAGLKYLKSKIKFNYDNNLAITYDKFLTDLDVYECIIQPWGCQKLPLHRPDWNIPGQVLAPVCKRSNVENFYLFVKSIKNKLHINSQTFART